MTNLLSLSLQSTQWFGQQGNGEGNPARYQDRPCYAHGVWVLKSIPCVSRGMAVLITCQHVLYSIHSSFAELQEFVSFMQPRSLIPLTECSSQALRSLSSSCFPARTSPLSVRPALLQHFLVTQPATSLSKEDLNHSEDAHTIPAEGAAPRHKKRARSTRGRSARDGSFCEDFIMAALNPKAKPSSPSHDRGSALATSDKGYTTTEDYTKGHKKRRSLQSQAPKKEANTG